MIIAEVVHDAGEHVGSEYEGLSEVPHVDACDNGRKHGEIGEGEEEQSAVVLRVRHALVFAVSACEVLRAGAGVDQSISQSVLFPWQKSGSMVIW